MIEDDENDLPEPEAAPGLYIEAGSESNGDLRRMKATRVLEDGTTEQAKIFQLTDQGRRNLMVALYGSDQVFMAEERFREISKGPVLKPLLDEVNAWRAKFALLNIAVEAPSRDALALYTAAATIYADEYVGTEPFPYGPDPDQWPKEVLDWMLAFTEGLIKHLITPPDASHVTST